jgi:hypothetical protein
VEGQALQPPLGWGLPYVLGGQAHWVRFVLPLVTVMAPVAQAVQAGVASVTSQKVVPGGQVQSEKGTKMGALLGGRSRLCTVRWGLGGIGATSG